MHLNTQHLLWDALVSLSGCCCVMYSNLRRCCDAAAVVARLCCVTPTVLEYGALGKEGDPQYVHTMQMAPILPPNTTWMKPTADPKTGAIPPGIKLAGARNESFETFIGKSFGPLTVSGNTSEDTFLRTGQWGGMRR